MSIWNKVGLEKLTLIQPPTATLLNLDEVKTWLSESSDHNDSLIEDIIGTVAEQLDGEKGTLGRSVLPQTWKYELQCFPRYYYQDYYEGLNYTKSCAIRLPYPPITQVVSVEYEAEDNTTKSLTTTYIYEELGRHYLTQDDAWPTDIKKMVDGIYPLRIIYNAGYANIPAGIRTAAKAMVAHLYDNRSEGMAMNSFSRNPAYVKMLRAYNLNI